VKTLNNILSNIELAGTALMAELWAMVVVVDAEEDRTSVGFSDTVGW
jgi:hypothetical protein